MESPAEDAYYSLAKKFVFFRLETSFFRLIIKEFGFVQRNTDEGKQVINALTL